MIPWKKGNNFLLSLINMLLKLRLEDAIYQLRFYSNSLIHVLSLSNSNNNVYTIITKESER